jgi:hypothetical protein
VELVAILAQPGPGSPHGELVSRRAHAARIDRPQPVPPGGGEKKWRGRDHPAAPFSDYLMAGASGFLGF